MQFSKCVKCAYNGHPCKFIMANAIVLLNDVQHLIDYSQTRKTKSKCILKIDYDCENFTPRGEHNTE